MIQNSRRKGMKKVEFNEEELKVMKTLVEYHIKEVEKDKEGFGRSPLAAIGIGENYEVILMEIMKKLK